MAGFAGHLFSFAVLWPLWSVLFAPGVLAANPLFAGVDPAALRWGMAYSAAQMWREFLAVGLLLASVSAAAAVVARAGLELPRSGLRRFFGGIFDALCVAVALLFGIALELPAALAHPALAWAGSIPVGVATAVLGVLALAIVPAVRGWTARSPKAMYRSMAVAVPIALCSWCSVSFQPAPERDAAQADVRLVFGIDSLSRAHPLEPLKAFTDASGGTWYERAVTPGLLTNPVWSAIISGRRPSEIGVFFTFQAPDWNALRPNLVTRAEDAGLRTFSFFSDQFTTYVGTDLPFHEDRSGPRGWKQVTTAAVKDASWWLPTVLPWIPRVPGALTPPNQAGTYAFSLRSELEDVFTAGQPGGGALVLAHLDYLHQARYPGYSDMAPGEGARVLRARLRTIRDLSLHWMYPEVQGEPLRVYSWKLRHLQATLTSVIAETGFLAASRGNALVLFSDHGDRSEVTLDGFGNEALYGVPLVTFGIPARDPSVPISLIDIGALLGLHADTGPGAEPLVEYTNVVEGEWGTLLKTSRPELDGGVTLDPSVLAAIGARMTAFRPYGVPASYAPAPAVPPARRQLPTEARAGPSSGRR